jgi:signal peptidase I
VSLTLTKSPALGALREPQAPRSRLRRSFRTGWVALVITMLSRGLLSALGGLVSTSLLPVLFGWHTAVVLSGSMEPRLTPGDIAVVRQVPADKLNPGQVLLVHDPDHPGRLRLHRLVAVRADGQLTLRGDANPHPDSSPVAKSAVLGVASLHVPWVALPDYWLQERRFGALGVLALAGAAVLGGAFLHRPGSNQVESTDEHGGEDGTEGPPQPDKPLADRSDKQPRRRIFGRNRRAAGTTTRRHRVLRRLATVLAVTLVLAMSGFAPSAFAWTTLGKAGNAANSGDNWTATNYFSCTDAVQATSPALYYRLADDGSTTAAADSSSANAAGTYQGSGTTFGVAGACPRDGNPAITLDGTSGWISTANSVNTPNVFTLEAWFKTTTGNGGDIISFGTSQAGTSPSATVDRAVYMTKTGAVGFGMGGNNNNVASSKTTYNDGQWHLVDAELSSSGMTLYVDALDIATKGSVRSGLNESGYWHIGYDDLSNMGNQAPGSNYFKGSLDEVAIYNTALTAQQIKDHYYAS